MISKTLCSAVAIFVTSIVATTANAASYAYDLIDLGTISDNGFSSFGNAVNDNGIVTGDSSGANGGFVWTNNRMFNLGEIPGGPNWIRGRGINNHGHIVGYGGSTTGADAFVWRDGTISVLPDHPNGAGYSIAYDINDNGQVVGRSGSVGVVWNNGQASSLAPLSGSTSRLTRAFAINNSGQIAGYGLTGRTGMTSRAVLWQGNSIVDLGQAEGITGASQARDINEHGQVVGFGTTEAGIRALLWEDGVAQVLGEFDGFGNGLLGQQSKAYGVNDEGQVVGSRRDSRSPNLFGFIWDSENGMQNLSDLIDPDLGWEIGSAFDINNHGQITGWGVNAEGRTRAFLLTPENSVLPAPIPLPAGLPLMLGAIVSLLALRRHRSRNR